jgi:S1-C subfamily serine protease
LSCLKDGEVIGISAITVKFAAGISFAIPIDEVKEFLQSVQEKKRLIKSGSNLRSLGPRQRWYIGINMLTLLPHILEELQRRDSSFDNLKGGVFVAGVNYRSPAHV